MNIIYVVFHYLQCIFYKNDDKIVIYKVNYKVYKLNNLNKYK